MGRNIFTVGRNPIIQAILIGIVHGQQSTNPTGNASTPEGLNENIKLMCIRDWERRANLNYGVRSNE